MKRSDLGIVMIHWMMVAILLGAAASGILLWDKGLQPRAAWLFMPDWVGVIHISLSAAVVAIGCIHFAYLKHKNLLSHILLRSWIVKAGQVNWKNVAILLYWALFAAVILETISGILLTKLVNQDVLARIFGVQKGPLLALHLYLVLLILAFPLFHVFVHWRGGKALSIFRPRVFERRPSMAAILARLKEENIRLKEARK